MPYTINSFFSDVNKKWLNQHNIPNNNVSISYFDLIEKNIEDRLIKIIHRVRRCDHNANPFADFIESCYSGTENDMNILHFFAESLSNFTDHTGLMKSIGLLNLYNLNSPIMMDFAFDMKNNSMYTVHLSEADTGLDKDDYLDLKNETMKGYLNYLDSFGKTLDFNSLKTDYLEIEKAITKVYYDPQADIDMETTYNPMPYANLCTEYPNLNFNLIFEACGISKTIMEKKTVIISNIEYMKLLNSYMGSKTLEFWRIWIKSCVYTSLHNILPEKVRKSYFDFYQHKLKGQRHEISKDKFVLDICTGIAPDSLGKLYIESDAAKFKDIKNATVEIIKQIKTATGARIMKLTWLSESSRQIAVHKLHKMHIKVAYPEIWYDSFKGVTIDKNQFLLNFLSLMKQQTLYNVQKMVNYTETDKRLWIAPCYEVNAFYLCESNEFCIPIGFLNPPFYSKEMSFVQIIAGLGNIVGHEISHGFDKDGRKYDENGNNLPWWTSKDLDNYNKRTKTIIDLFNSTDFHGLHVNGTMTLDENLADFGALAICLDVLHDNWKSKSDSYKKKELREFFIWYSKTWAYKATRQQSKMAIKTNVHAPAELRVNTLLPHFEDFYYAFDFTEKDYGFIKPEKRVDVWGHI